MPTKQETIDSINPSGTYTGTQVRHLVHSVRTETPRCPKFFRKGDVIGVHIANKIRPVIVIKVMEECLALIPLTTEPDSCHVLMPCVSRFNDDRDSFYTKSLTMCSMEHARENFMGVIDNPKEVNKAIRKLKEFYSTVL